MTEGGVNSAQIIIGWLQDVAEVDVAYENIMAEPTLQLQMLADALGVSAKVTSVTKVCLPFAPASSIWAASCQLIDYMLSAAPVCIAAHSEMNLKSHSASFRHTHPSPGVHTAVTHSVMPAVHDALRLCMRVSMMLLSYMLYCAGGCCRS